MNWEIVNCIVLRNSIIIDSMRFELAYIINERIIQVVKEQIIQEKEQIIQEKENI